MYGNQYNQPHQSPNAQRNSYQQQYRISQQFPQSGLHNGSQFSTISNYNNNRSVDMRYSNSAAAAAVAPISAHPQYKPSGAWGTGEINASGNGSLTSSLTYGTNNTNTANNPGNFAQANPNMFSATAQPQQAQTQNSRRIPGSANMPLRLGAEAHYQQSTHQSSIGTY
jgi:hypothetical protein